MSVLSSEVSNEKYSKVSPNTIEQCESTVKESESERLIELRKKLTRYEICIDEFDIYVDANIKESTKIDIKFLEYIHCKHYACLLEIAIEEFLHGIKYNPLRKLHTGVMHIRTQRMRKMYEKKFCEMFDDSFKNECIDLVEKADRLILAHKLLNDSM
tara:strand:- start:4742 stop:5212 length:471 start_codon:yes stop_codon:yes gene_type:complete